MKLSVVVPTHNRGDVLFSRSLPAIFAQDLPADDYEVIVVNDGSSDGTVEMLRGLNPKCGFRVLEQPHRGPGAARNNGVAAARAGLILFLDDDIIASPGLLRQHVAAHTGPNPHVVHGSLYIAPETPSSLLRYANESWYRNYNARLDSQAGLNWPDETFLISNTSLPRATLLACGGFDERLPAKEDHELGFRLWKMGVRFEYLPQAVAYEFFVKSSPYYLRNEGRMFGRAEVMLCRKHPEYRPYSELAGLGRTPLGRRLWRQVVLQLPASPAGMLAAPIRVCERLCRFPAMQRAGYRLLSYGRRIAELRSAAKEAGSPKALQREFATRLPVLLYHHVGPPRPGTMPGITTSPARFERQMRWLARRGYTGICPADWVRWLREGKGLPRKPVLLTFDDGYADLAEHALPILRRHGFGAVVFIVTGQVGGTNAWDEARGSATLRLMTAEQIRDWADQGIEFGAHGRKHADLTTLSARDLAEEVTGSVSDLAAILGSRVVSFAYPYGFYNQAVRDCVRQAVDLAFIADEQKQGTNDLLTDPYLLRRTMVQTGDFLVDLEFRALWGTSPLQDVRARLRLRSRVKRVARSVFGPHGLWST